MSTVFTSKKSRVHNLQKNKNYEALANSSHDFMSLINRDLEYEVVNDAYRRALCPELQNIEGRKIADIWKAGDLERSVMPNLRRCFAGESILHEEWFRFHQHGYGYFEVHFSPHYDRLGRVSHVVVVSRDITARRRAVEEGKRLIFELQRTIREMKRLKGMIPICACCKKIRDEDGDWQQVEKYIQDHTEAKFSHGICPECAQRLYPDLVMEINQRNKSDM